RNAVAVVIAAGLVYVRIRGGILRNVVHHRDHVAVARTVRGNDGLGRVGLGAIVRIGNVVAIRIPIVGIGTQGNFEIVSQAVTVAVNVASVADAVAVQVGLIGIRHGEAIVMVIGDRIIVVIVGAGVTDVIPVHVRLVGIGREGAVIVDVRHA